MVWVTTLITTNTTTIYSSFLRFHYIRLWNVFDGWGEVILFCQTLIYSLLARCNAISITPHTLKPANCPPRMHQMETFSYLLLHSGKECEQNGKKGRFLKLENGFWKTCQSPRKSTSKNSEEMRLEARGGSAGSAEMAGTIRYDGPVHGHSSITGSLSLCGPVSHWVQTLTVFAGRRPGGQTVIPTLRRQVVRGRGAGPPFACRYCPVNNFILSISIN